MTSKAEYEANIFASDLLIDDDEILSLIYEEREIYNIAGELSVDINLALIKVAELRKRGHDLRELYRPPSDFLRK
jgi:Zn-dependent peptidase ImmA (M78 family)